MSLEAYAVLDARDGKLLEARNEHSSAAPGSTVKPFLPLDGDAICRGALTIGGHRLDCTHPPAAGPVRGSDALALSCNHFFARMALRKPPEAIRQALHDFEPALAQSDAQRQLQALGHWGVSATPLRLARAYYRLLHTDRASLLAGGKTGTTAQAAWFAGWPPAERPSVVIAVMTGGRGFSDARPVAMRLLEKWSR